MSSISSIHGAMDGKFLKTLTVGKPNFATGKIRIDGTTSGRVTITAAAAAGTWTLTLPSTGGTADYVLSTDGAGAASWISGQSIAGLKTTSTPQFARLGLNAAADAAYLLNLGGTLIHGTATGIGIGTTGPATPLHVSGASTTGGDGRFNVRLDDTTAFASGVGAGIQFVGKNDAGGTLTGFATIKGIKENGTSGNTAGALVFTTNPNAGSNTERMRIDSSGNVTIGSTTATSMFNVGTSAQFQVSSTGAISTTSVGPHAIGGAIVSNTQLLQTGSFTVAGDNAFGYRLSSTINVASGWDAPAVYINPTIVEAASGVHALLAFWDVNGSITNGVATTTDAVAANIRTFVAATGTTTATGLRVAKPTGATNNYIQQWLSNDGTQLGYLDIPTRTRFVLTSANFGNNVEGATIISRRNTSGGTEGQSAGTMAMDQASGNLAFIWPDNTAAPGKLRIHTAAPTGNAGAPTVSDTAGIVVGDQTCWHPFKNILRERTDPEVALQAVLSTKVYDFTYKSDSYLTHDDKTPIFTGVVISDEDLERDAWFGKNYGRQQIPSLNEINLHGYVILAIKALEKENEQLGARVAVLEASKLT